MTVHVFPAGDVIEHELHGDRCVCGPATEHVEPDLGVPYPDGPVVLHFALEATGAGPWLSELELGIGAP